MNFIVLVVITVFLSLIALFATILAFDREVKKRTAIIFVTLSASCILWWIAINQTVNIIEYEEVLPVKNIDSPDGSVQIVAFFKEKETKILNLNKHFGSKIDENAKIKHTVFSRGPYFGIYVLPHQIPDKWEIVK